MLGDRNRLIEAGILGLNDLYRQRAVTPLEVLEATLNRIDRLDGAIRSFVQFDPTAERAAALSAERWRSGRARGPLDGAPIAVKANIAVKGLAWTGAIAALADEIAAEDAYVVARLRKAGAVIVGLVSLHEAALGATNDGPLYGKCFNPLKPGYTPGGSSGGSGAALAAGFVAGALGTDTMGSVRIPAAYCGVYGLKPTYGVVSQRGLRNLAFSLDHIGPMARRVEDVAALFDAMAAPDQDDPFAIDGKPAPAKPLPASGLTLGRVRFEGEVEVAPEVYAAFEESLAVWRSLGARIVDVTLADYSFAPARRKGLLISEAEGALVLSDMLEARPDGFSEGLAAMLAYGRDAPAVRLAAAYQMMARAKYAARQAFAVCDAMILPTAPQAAFPHADPAPANQADLTAFANFSGIPAMALPMGVGRDNMPVSLQILAPWRQDRFALALASRFVSS